MLLRCCVEKLHSNLHLATGALIYVSSGAISSSMVSITSVRKSIECTTLSLRVSIRSVIRLTRALNSSRLKQCLIARLTTLYSSLTSPRSHPRILYPRSMKYPITWVNCSLRLLKAPGTGCDSGGGESGCCRMTFLAWVSMRIRRKGSLVAWYYRSSSEREVESSQRWKSEGWGGRRGLMVRLITTLNLVISSKCIPSQVQAWRHARPSYFLALNRERAPTCVAQSVERQPFKLMVEGSSPFAGAFLPPLTPIRPSPQINILYHMLSTRALPSIVKSLTNAVLFGASKRRVRELSQVRISLDEQPAPVESIPQVEYEELSRKVRGLGWESMDFSQLCSLPPQTLQATEMFVRKDKFNVSDADFVAYAQNSLGVDMAQVELNVSKMSPYYQRMYYLLTNQNKKYDELQQITQPKLGYMGEMYLYDLTRDGLLASTLTYFVNKMQFPDDLELVTEPSLIKHLLTTKRELILQGASFETKKDDKEKKKEIREMKKALKLKRKKQTLPQKKVEQEGREEQGEQQELATSQPNKQEVAQQQADQEEQQWQNYIKSEQQLSNLRMQLTKLNQNANTKVSVTQVLGYEYEFWVDVKHNRQKNGEVEDYVIETRDIANPNSTLLLTQKYPKLTVKYIVHKKKRKDYAMHFVIKADLLLTLNGKHSRRAKVEWRGPSSDSSHNAQPAKFMVVDWEGMMGGNPTIPRVFRL